MRLGLLAAIIYAQFTKETFLLPIADSNFVHDIQTTRTTTAKRPKMEDIWAVQISYPRLTFQLLALRKKGHRPSCFSHGCNVQACRPSDAQQPFFSSQEKSIFSSSIRAVRTSWSVKAPEIIRCFRAWTASMRSSTVPFTMNLLIETVFV